MKDINDWLNSDKDFFSGIDIFAKYCKNKNYIRILKNGGKNAFQKKLEYEMKKLAAQPLTTQRNIQKNTEEIKSKNQDKIPDIIREAKEIRTTLKTRIALLHNQLYELGESNDQKTVKNRKKILNERSPLIVKYETIYQLIEQYFITGIVPNSLVNETKNNENLVIPDKKMNYNELDDMELILTKNRLASRITKQKNILKYQSAIAKTEPCPMPEGLKRKAAEEKLKQLESDYNQIIDIIKNRKQC